MLADNIFLKIVEKKIPAKADVDIVGEYNPSPFDFRPMESWKPGKLPAQF